MRGTNGSIVAKRYFLATSVTKKLDHNNKRLARFLLDESSLEGSNILSITHETIGNHLGSAREVVTRMLRYFQNEGIVKPSRGKIEILSPEKLESLCSDL
ncbi:MAG TPA: helix-turn-helix domain-containing protein [Candidatus Anaerostipes avistercoris]|uniref:Helix-turn-helix domain-containing protein n=1 Tax=Candidatus Anaerostipes avistercoris TaxID=2838462 RepID=A0A9D2PK63_9FIRM|nr:helix-turn-helix domain-containing protein [Candidatus Anaerostipes avistercoris]